ncbi:MAG: sle [Frankiales bacterium]|nr:sle [Frankiales bacterium]
MSAIDEWQTTLQDALELPPTDTNLILDVARDAAHTVARPAAPITTYLMGLAAGRSGADPAAVAAQIRALLPPRSDDAE